MSMSVCKAENIKMGYKIITRRSPIAKVKRCLFGPVDPEENKAFLQHHLSVDYARDCTKWNFDFHEETTLDPNGDFIWQSASPIRINRKRKTTIENIESSAYYFQPIEPAARSENQAKVKVQTQITDYMAKAKRPVVCIKDQPPKKIPKLTEFCSS